MSEKETLEQLKPGRYRHYKGPEYDVLYTARHSETEEWLVVYKLGYGDRSVWVRPLAMFCEEVALADGTSVPRFERISD